MTDKMASAGLSRLAPWFLKQGPEHPKKFDLFREKVSTLKWDGQNARSSLTTMYNELEKLAEAEIKYYFGRRKRQSIISTACRIAGWIFGSLGLLLPLYAATQDAGAAKSVAWGYVSLAVAAAAFGADTLFVGTSGHIRFVAAQLGFEQLMVSTRLAWARYFSGLPEEARALEPEQVIQGIDLLVSYASAIHTAALAETDVWARAIQEQARTFASSLQAGQQAHNTNASQSGTPNPGGYAGAHLQRSSGAQINRDNG